MEQADKNKNTNFDFEIYDTYEWYLKSRAALEHQRQVSPRLDSLLEFQRRASGLRRILEKEAWVSQLHASTVPNLNVAGFWDQEDPWGPWQIFRHAEENDPQHTNFIVAGPWFHGEWQSPKGDSIGQIPFGSHETAREFRENIEAPSSAITCMDRAKTHVAGQHLPERLQHAGIPTQHGLRKRRRAPICTCARMARFRSRLPTANGPATTANTYLIPANPVPYRQRPISPTYPRRRLAHMGSRGPAIRRSPPGRALFRQRAARSRSHDHGPARRRTVRFHLRHGQRFHRQADRRLSRGRAKERVECRGRSQARPIRPVIEWIRVAHRDGCAPWPLSRELRDSASAHREQADRMANPAARSRSRVPQGTPHHGPDPVHMVPRHRPQSAEVRTQHLQGEGGRFRDSHATDLLFARSCRPIDPPSNRLKPPELLDQNPV